MARIKPDFTDEQFKFIADFFGALAGCPSDIVELAEKIKPNDSQEFTNRATAAWEQRHLAPRENEIDELEVMEDRKINRDNLNQNAA